ncbi:cell division protein FtsA [Rhodocytophaga aerolata]|uniref:Cell division protein FtsA n=1 Tax=Rhodocytophaga aerolata TaxID=455078 RepID=A0ABT8R123_9BACT|nr:cell division protein FtsA [Rhodocytophaga aerolata]MDO1445792.1 cell division protein FtsA [Rhodocytophaga aerolata]
MQKDKIVVGLDIGSTKICAIVGRKNDYGKLEILGMGKANSEGVTRGLVTNIDKTVDAIIQAVAEAEAQSGINIRVVNVGISGQHIKSMRQRGSITRNSSDEEIGVADINRLTNDMYRTVIPPGSEIIHVLPQNYSVDYEGGIKDPVGMSGIKLEADFHIITAQTTAVHNINKCVRRANLEIENLILEPIASSMAVLTQDEKEAGVALVDIGGGTTDITIYYDNIIRHTAVIPFGGSIITSDIKEGCMVMQNQAESLKVKFGKAIAEVASWNEVVSIPGLRNRLPKEISVKNLAHIIEARMEEIIEMVHAEIIRSGYENRLPGGVVITGGGAQLTDAKELFELVTGMDARIGYPNEYLGKSKIETIKNPMYATSVGLVLAGFQAIDDRENRYVQVQTAKASPAVAPPKEARKPQGNDFFRRILDRTRSFMIDDFEDKDKNDY